MVNTIGWFIEQALSVLGILFGIYIFGYIIRHGTGTIKDLVRTIGLTVKAICSWVVDKISDRREEHEEEEEKRGKHEPSMTYDEFCEKCGIPTREEFDKMMTEHKTMHL